MKVSTYLSVFCTTLLVDLSAKEYIETTWKDGEEKEGLKGISIRKVYNKGMALNILENYPNFVKRTALVLTSFFSIYYSFLLYRKGAKIQKMGWSILLGGAWSNVYDRVVRGHVIDYIGFKTRWKHLSDITYNLGDFFIFAGSILVGFSMFGKKKTL